MKFSSEKAFKVKNSKLPIIAASNRHLIWVLNNNKLKLMFLEEYTENVIDLMFLKGIYSLTVDLYRLNFQDTEET